MSSDPMALTTIGISAEGKRVAMTVRSSGMAFAICASGPEQINVARDASFLDPSVEDVCYPLSMTTRVWSGL